VHLKVRLFEIFTSVEGEGILYGTKTLFVRLAGCPFTCFYCDTLESLPMDSGIEYSTEEASKLIDKKLEKNTYKVNFTGGEPLVQSEAVLEMAKHVKSRNIPTYLESSCYDSQKFSTVLPYIDYIKIEFKTPEAQFIDSKHYSKLIENALDCLRTSIELKKTTYIKIVVSSKTELNSFRELLNKIFKIISKKDISGFIIQPTFGIAEPSLEQLLKLYDLVYPYYEEVRVVPQLHKLIGAP
jgi:7-carboxy-7-deazaguanine synthase